MKDRYSVPGRPRYDDRDPLTQGKVALIDDEDLPLVQTYKWNAHKEGRDLWYALSAEFRDKKRQVVRMHRLVLHATGTLDVDHRNGDGLDNRKENLRMATRARNVANQRLSTRNNSGYRGVAWNRWAHKWRVQTRIDGRRIHVGYFDDLLDAARAYDVAACDLFGEFARPNFPKEDA